MTKSTDTSTAANPVFRVLFEEPGTGWRKYPMKQFEEVYLKGFPLPALSSQLVRMAFAHLVRGDDGASCLDRLSVEMIRFNAEGRMDEDYFRARIAGRIDPTSEPIDFSLMSTEPVSMADIQAICRCIDVEVPARFKGS